MHGATIKATLKHVMFLRKRKEKNFFVGIKMLAEVVFVTQPSSNAGYSVRRIVWVTTNFYLMSDMFVGVVSLEVT
jgi:hypothetical protein